MILRWMTFDIEDDYEEDEEDDDDYKVDDY